MTRQEILEKAIQKAIVGGWDCFGYRHSQPTLTITPVIKQIQFRNDGAMMADCDIATLIFNHDFAKALWGEVVHANFYAGKHGDTIDFKGLNWKGHLINMVIADDPIQYLGENI